jgi:hypothetical protein
MLHRGRVLLAIRSRDAQTRSQGFRHLVREPDPALVGELVRETRYGSVEAADALVALRKSATLHLMRSLAKPSPKPLVTVLGRLGADSTDELLAGLAHPNGQVRTLSAMALGCSVDQRVPFALLDRLDSAALVDAVGVGLVEWARRHHRDVSEDLLERLLVELRRPQASEHLRELTLMLSSSDDPRVAPLLVAMLDDPAARRWWDHCVMMLVRVSHPVVEPTLLRVLRDSDRSLGAHMDAIRGLARLQSRKARPILDELAGRPMQRPRLPCSFPEQEAWKLKLMAQEALRHLDDPAKPMSPDYALMQPLAPHVQADSRDAS